MPNEEVSQLKNSNSEVNGKAKVDGQDNRTWDKMVSAEAEQLAQNLHSESWQGVLEFSWFWTEVSPCQGLKEKGVLGTDPVEEKSQQGIRESKGGGVASLSQDQTRI